MSALLDQAIPLCFDTCAVFGTSLLKLARRAFPERELIVPAWVVAERVRQLQEQRGSNLEIEIVRAFLHDAELKLKIAAFDETTATTGWLAVTRALEGPWSWGGADQTTRPCAHRCRSGDYTVASVAVTVGAVLITDDAELKRQVLAGKFPLAGCHTSQELRTLMETQA